MKTYAEREREFVLARVALAEEGARYAECFAETGDGNDEALDAATRRYRAAERGLRKARKREAA